MLIKGGIIIDGSGKDRFVANIRIQGEKIVEIGDLEPGVKEEVIDASGLYVAPGFVDILNHSDAFVTLFENPAQESLLRQGVTTMLMGNCGSSLAPLRQAIFVNSIQKWGDTSKINVNWLSVREYLNELEMHQFGPNLATLIGHSTVRRGFTGSDPRELSGEELRQMEYMIERGMNEGAFGISLGLGYAHGDPATPEELRIIAGLAKKYNALLSAHIRDEGEDFKSSVEEILEIAKGSGANIEISHLKSANKEYWNEYGKALEELNKSEHVNFDVYPYDTSASVLYSFLPKWAAEKGNLSLFKTIENTGDREKLIQEMKNGPYSYKDMVIAMGAVNPTYFGKKLGEVAEKQGKSPEETVLNLILTSHNRVIVFAKTMDEKNISKAIMHEKSFVSSDGVGYKAEDAKRGEFVHPRYFGAFPKFLAKYAREEQLLSLEKAIHKITLGPAKKIGLDKRGRIESGFYADLVIFDYDSLGSAADFTDPYKYPEGISHVLVNGQRTIDAGELKDLSGQVLTRP